MKLINLEKKSKIKNCKTYYSLKMAIKNLQEMLSSLEEEKVLI